jgi:hypothetical protein
MNATKTVFQTIAAELSAAFETATRTNGENFYRIRETAPEWILCDTLPNTNSLMYRVHSAVDDRPPCDWVYEIASRAADWAEEFETVAEAQDCINDFIDGAVDIYTADLFHWAESGNNREICDRAVSEYGQPGDGFDTDTVSRWIAGGQSIAAGWIAQEILGAIDGEARRRGE